MKDQKLQSAKLSINSGTDFLAGGGEMGALMRGFDWAGTPLGAVEGWPQSLRTAVSILVAGRVTKGDLTSPAFFGIVLGIWSLKLILFFVLSLWLRTQDWLDPAAFGFTAIGAVLGSLVADAVAFQRIVNVPPRGIGGQEPQRRAGLVARPVAKAAN